MSRDSHEGDSFRDGLQFAGKYLIEFLTKNANQMSSAKHMDGCIQTICWGWINLNKRRSK